MRVVQYSTDSLLARFVSPRRGPPPCRRFCVRNLRRNRQFDFRAGIHLTPDCNLTADLRGALMHSCHAVMSGTAAGAKHLRIDALPVVPNAQAELAPIK